MPDQNPFTNSEIATQLLFRADHPTERHKDPRAKPAMGCFGLAM